VFTTILTFLVIWAALIVVLGAGAAWLQGYIYSEVSPGLSWRAPVAGTILMAFIALWAYLDAQDPPNRFPALFNFSPTDVKTYDQLTVVDDTGKKTVYVRRAAGRVGGGVEYVDQLTGSKRIPSRPLTIIAKDTKSGEEATFEAERDPQTLAFVEHRRGIRYLQKDGTQEISENTLGQVSTFRWGQFLAYWLLVLTFLAAWFLCLWLLLQFQWAHALGLALVLWLVVVLIVMPVVLARVA
jgi:hypothetical protein